MKSFKHLPVKPKLILSIEKKPYIRKQHYNPFKLEKEKIKHEKIKENLIKIPYINDIFTRVAEYYITNLILNSRMNILSKISSPYFKYHAELIFKYLDQYNKDFINNVKKDLFTVTLATLIKEGMHLFDSDIFAYFNNNDEEFSGLEAFNEMFKEKFISKDTYELFLNLDQYFKKEFDFYESIKENPLFWRVNDTLSWASLKWFMKYMYENKNKYNFINVIKDLIKIFDSNNEKIFWASKYGGEAYKRISEILLKYVNNELSDTAFVESIFNIYHNTGMLLNKYEEWDRLNLLNKLPKFFDERQKSNDFIDLFYNKYLSNLEKFYNSYKNGFIEMKENPFFYNYDLFEKIWMLSYYIDESSKTKYHQIIQHLGKVFQGVDNLKWLDDEYIEKLLKLIKKIK